VKSLRPDDPKRARKKELWSLAREIAPYVAAEHPDGIFLVPTRAHRKFFLRGAPKDAIVLGRAVDILRARGRETEGTLFVDVGAHIGTTSIVALTRYSFGRAVAIEPDPENARLLRANVALNGLHERVAVVEAAVSDTAGTQLFLPGRRDDPAYLWMKGEIVNELRPRAISIRTLTLNGLCETNMIDPSEAGVVWLDCQKHEEQALRSASAVFAERVPIVFALRPRKLGAFSSVLPALERAYEVVIDLRRPNSDPEAAWTPVLHPVGDLLSMPTRKGLTDVLVC
jgi:FkbM family methyltransferase